MDISVLKCACITLYSVPPVTGIGLCVEDSALGTEEAVSEEDTKSRDAPVEDLAARWVVCIVRAGGQPCNEELLQAGVELCQAQ